MALHSQKLALATLSLVTMTLLSSCSSGGGGGGDAAPVGPPIIKKVERSNYLSGQRFCEKYSELTSKEHGIRVTVPLNYDNPNAGTMTIYAYTHRPFDPSKPSYIFVDGGPGQNTHGSMPEYLGGEMNEIRFDQRGLGCSAPETWELYKDARLYSSQNTIRDMDEIRKAYKIAKWSVYGVSYGTVPATMYGSAYPNNTISVVLEGVVGTGDLLHLWSYKIEKLNLMLSHLTERQRDAFSELVFEGTPESNALFSYLFQSFYMDSGLRSYLSFLNSVLDKDGVIDRYKLQKLKEILAKREEKYPHPQQPGAVDENVMNIIYCRELNYRQKDKTTVNYRRSIGFFEGPNDARDNAATCDEAGIRIEDEHLFELSEHPVKIPVYYFQGSHDGATIAQGAIEHWKAVPKSKSYFLLAQKGGHNPNLTRLDNKDSKLLQKAEVLLFRKSVTGAAIAREDIADANKHAAPDEKWLLYFEPTMATDLEPELEGIRKL